MKGLARSFVYWPGLDEDIGKLARSCVSCSQNAHNPPKCENHHSAYPKGPWERVHIDYAGPVGGTMLLIVSDAFSKWLEVKTTNSITTTATIGILDELFAAYGVPVTIVSDNGTNFKSEEFKNFLQRVGVKFHKLTAPYHPAINGQAERAVQTIKNGLRAMGTTKITLQENLNEFLRQYRRAPHSTTGQPPSQLFLGRLLRNRLDLVFPQDIASAVTDKQFLKTNAHYRSFAEGQNVWFLTNNPRMEKWVQGKITMKLGDLHYQIEHLGKTHKRHIDQIRKHTEREVLDNTRSDQGSNQVARRIHFYPRAETTPPVTTPPNINLASHQTPTIPVREPRPSAIPVLRKSVRQRRPRTRYSP